MGQRAAKQHRWHLQRDGGGQIRGLPARDLCVLDSRGFGLSRRCAGQSQRAGNPGDLYGVSKCFGEALGRYMAEQEELSVIVLRIGGFQPPEAARKPNLTMMDAWVSHRDLNQLIEKSIDVKNLKFAILHGLSDNRFKRLDISDARQLVGYAPQDDFTRENPLLQILDLDEVETASVRDEGAKSGLRQELRGN